jgi:hypothetical protein
MDEQVIEIPSPFLLPDGKYRGFWGGYEVSVATPKGVVVLKTELGIRTFALPVFVTIEGTKATVVPRD